MNRSRIKIETGSFFDERAALFLAKPKITRRDLCYMSGRDYRVWTEDIYTNLIESIGSMLDLNPQITLLEVGCAAGFLAQGVSPKVLKYMGVDLSPVSLKLARRLDLPNAVFRPANATVLPFGDSHFDRALCYDVFTNISDLEVCKKIIAEMARVVKPDGCFLIGSLADARAQVGYEQKVSELSASLPPFMDDPDIVSKKWMPWQYRLLTMWHKARKHQPSQIFCYYFDPDLFVGIGKDLGLKVEILPIHSRNPYASYRFNVLFLK